MLLKFFKNKQPLMYLLLPITILVLWYKWLFGYIEFSGFENSLVLKSLFSFINHNSIVFAYIISLSFLLLSFLLVKFNEKFQLTDNSSFLTAFFYILIVSCINPSKEQSHLVFASIFLFISLIQVFNTHKREIVLSNLFNSAFLLAIGSLFYAKLLFLFPIIIISIIISRNFNWREWTSLFIGLIVPFILYFSGYFLFDNLDLAIRSFNIDLFNTNPEINFKFDDIIISSLLGTISVFSVISVFTDYNSKKIGTRNVILTIFLLLIGIIIIFLFFGMNSFELLNIAAIPLSIFIANYFSKNKMKWLKEVLFTLFIGAIIYSQIIG